MTQPRLHALLGAALLCALNTAPASAATCAPPSPEAAEPARPKKKGLGLGGLLKAARNAGVGSMLGSGSLLGDGKAAQVTGAVAGTAVAASDGSGANLAGTVVGLAGQGRAAQVAGAVTGTAAELARTGAPLAAKSNAMPESCAPAQPATTAPAATTWN